MFSTHLPKVNTVSREHLYLGAGLLLIAAMLMAIATVAGGEVRKAKTRDSLQASQQTAVVYCVETQRGAALSSCIQQARAEPYGADQTTVADNTAAFSRSAAVAPSGTQGFMSVGFSAHR